MPVTVTFTHRADGEQEDEKTEASDDTFPVTVENVEYFLRGDELPPADPGPSKEVSDKQAAFDIPPATYVDQALDIIDSAPTFDHLLLDDLQTGDIVVTVSYEDLPLGAR